MVEIPTRGRRCRASGPTLGTEYGEPAPSATGAGRARELDFLPVFPDGGAPGAAPRVGTTGLAAANKKPGSFPVPSVRGGSGPQHRGTSSGRINRILEAAKLRKPVAPPSLKAVVLGVNTTKSASGAAPDGFSGVAPGLVAETAATVAATSRNSNKGFKPAAPASRSQSEQAPGGTDNTSYTITNTPAATPASSSASTRPGARPIVASAKMRRREEGRSSSSILASIRNLIQQRSGSRGGPRPPCSAPSATTAAARDMQGPRPPSASQRRPPRPKSGNQQRRAVPSLPSSSKESSHASSASAKGPPPDTSTEKRGVGYAYSPHSKETACSMTSMEKEVFEVPPPPDLSCWAAATAIASAEAMTSEINKEKSSQPSPSAAPPAPQEFEATAAGTTSENATSSCSPAAGAASPVERNISVRLNAWADSSSRPTSPCCNAATSGGADEVSDDSMKAVVGTAGTEAEAFSPSLAAEPQPTLFSTPVAPTSSSATAAAGGGPRKRQSVGFKTATFPEDGPEGPRGADIDTVTEGAAADGSTRTVSARGASSRTPREATTSASPTARQIVERTRRRERERDAADKTRGTAAAVSVPPTSGSAGVASRRQERQASPLTSAFGGEGRSFGFVGSAGGATSGASNSSIKRLKSPTRQMQSGGYLGSSLPASEYDVMLSSMQLCEVVDPKTGKPKIVPKSEAARNAAKDGSSGGACSDPHAAAAAARVNAQRQRELACRQRQTTERLAMPIAQQTKRLKLGFGEASPVPQPRELPPMICPTGNFVTTATSAASSRPGTPGWVSHLRQKATQGQMKTPTKQYARVITPGHRYPPGTPGARISGRPASSGAATSSRGGVGRPVSRSAGGGGSAAADGSSRKGRSRSSGGWQKKSFTFYTIDGSPRRSSPTYSAGGRGYRGTGDARLDFSAEHFRVPTMEERRMWAARERQAQMEESVRKREAERTEKITELLRNLAQHGESVRKGVAAVAEIEKMENAAGEDSPTEEVGAAPRLQEFSEENEEVCRKEAPQETMVDVRTDNHDDEEYAADFDEDDPSSEDKAPAAEGAISDEQDEEADKVSEKESSAEASCSDADEDALDERDDHEDNDPGEDEPKPMCLQEKQTVRNRLQDELRALEAAAIAKQNERKPAAGGSSLPSAPSSPQNQMKGSEEKSKNKRDDCCEDDALPLDSAAVEDLVQQARERAKLRQQEGANSSSCASGSAFGADDDDITGAGSATTAQGDDDGENDTETRDEDGVHEIPLYCRFLQPADPIYMQSADFDPKSVPATSLMKLLNQSGTWYHEDPFEQPPGDTRCLCRDLNESFIWVEDDLPESEPEEPPPEYYQEQEMMRQYYEQQQEAGGGVRRAASF